MADPVESGAKSAGNFLTRKIGPLPMWAWLAVALVLYLYFERQQAASTSTTAANQQTDPAGNVGTIDPATGYVYGTPEDLAALAANNTGSTSSGSAGQSATSGAQTYADNNAWGIAAVNYLVGLGIDATTANQAIQQYLASQNLTTAQQADVNLAITALGPPPSLPGPTAGSPPPVTSPPGTGTGTGTPAGGSPPSGGSPPKTPTPKKTAPVPTGFIVSAKHSTSATVKWNRSAGATGYHLKCTDQATKKGPADVDTSAATTSYTWGGLTPSHSYVFDVWAEPEAGSPGTGAHAEVSATLPRTG
jgi:hypothetical protein